MAPRERSKRLYENGCRPNHENRAHRMPSIVIVDIPKYTGPALFSDSAKIKIIPLTPRTMQADDDATVTRKQFPLTLAWALAAWKAQGMTLAKDKLNTSQAVSSSGVLSAALSRIRHPDTLMLHDNFPSYAQIMRGRMNNNFKMRQAWERKIRAK